MKHLFRLVAPAAVAGAGLLLAAAAPGPAEDPVRWAVVIGIGEYADTAIAPVEFADDDAWAFASFLGSPEAGQGAVAPENLRLLLNEDATARNIRSALITFLRRSRPEDVIYVFLAGHSATDPDRAAEVYFLPYDTELDHLVETGVPLYHVFHALGQAYAYQKVIFADVSHSRWIQREDRRGLLPNPVNRQLLDGGMSLGPRFLALTASEPGQPSLSGARWGGGHGVFTHYLLEGLRGGADLDGDRAVRLGELVDYTRERVRRATRGEQLPTASTDPFDAGWIVSTPD